MRVFGCIAYAKVMDNKRTKLDAKGIKCMLLGYCEGTKAYRLMCLETKKIIKSRDVTFMEDSGTHKHLEERPSGRDEERPAHVVDESSKSDDGEESGMDDHEAEVQPAASGTSKNVGAKKGASKVLQPAPSRGREGQTMDEPRYPTRVRKSPGEWWKNHILPRPDVEHANVAFVEDPPTMGEAI